MTDNKADKAGCIEPEVFWFHATCFLIWRISLGEIINVG